MRSEFLIYVGLGPAVPSAEKAREEDAERHEKFPKSYGCGSKKRPMMAAMRCQPSVARMSCRCPRRVMA
jgi:hypothetical protein